MNRVEEVPHLQSVWRQSDFDRRLGLINQIRDVALHYLKPIMADIPRDLSEHIRAAYLKKGISLDWVLTSEEDAREFCFIVKKSELPAFEKQAAELLLACTTVIAAGTLAEHEKDWVFHAYAMLDAPAVEKGKKFRPGRAKGSMTEKTKYIYRLVAENPTDIAKVLHTKADKSIIGNMPETTFAGHVTAARNPQGRPKKR